MALFLPQRWRRQPTGFPAVDFSCPLSKGLVFAALPAGGNFVDVVSRTMSTDADASNPCSSVIQSTNAGAWRPGVVQAVQNVAGATNSGNVWLPGQTRADTEMVTTGTALVIAGIPAGSATRAPPIFSSQGSANGKGWKLSIDDYWIVARGAMLGLVTTAGSFGNGVGNGSWDVLTSDPKGKLAFFGFGWDAASLYFYSSGTGLKVETAANTETAGLDAADRRTVINRAANNTTSLPSYVGLALAWNRVLSLSEYVALWQNPWQLFAPQKRVLYFGAAAGGAGVTGILTGTLGAATLSSTGVLPIVGVATPTLAAATLSSTGTLPIVGVASQTLAAATLTSAGSSGANGVVTATLDAATLAATATLPIVGTATSTLAAATLSSASTITIVGVVSGTLGAATLSATGVGGITAVGSLSVQLADATLTAVGSSTLSGSLSAILDAATLTSSGAILLRASATPTLGAATLTAAGYGGTAPPAVFETDPRAFATGGLGPARLGVKQRKRDKLRNTTVPETGGKLD